MVVDECESEVEVELLRETVIVTGSGVTNCVNVMLTVGAGEGIGHITVSTCVVTKGAKLCVGAGCPRTEMTWVMVVYWRGKVCGADAAVGLDGISWEVCSVGGGGGGMAPGKYVGDGSGIGFEDA
jgi:hypothetical protein